MKFPDFSLTWKFFHFSEFFPDHGNPAPDKYYRYWDKKKIYTFYTDRFSSLVCLQGQIKKKLCLW